MKKRSLTLLTILTVIALLLTFSGCDNGTGIVNDPVNNNDSVNNSDDSLDNNEPTDEIEYDPYNELSVIYEPENQINIEYMMMFPADVNTERNAYILDALENKFNINLSLSPFFSGEGGQLDLAISSNSLPDCGWTYGVGATTAIQYHKAGATRTIPVDYVQKYAPYFASLLEREPMLHSMQLDETGENYIAFYAYRAGYLTRGYSICMRYDWLTNLGFEAKGNVIPIIANGYITDEPYNTEEFFDVLYEFTYSDPDQNGEADTYGMGIFEQNITGNAYKATLASAYSLFTDFSMQPDGSAIKTDYSKNLKKAYSELSKWIDQKVVKINPSFGSNVSNWVNEVIGSSSEMLSAYDYREEIPNGLFVNNPEATCLIAPPLINTDGTGGGSAAYEDTNIADNLGFFFVKAGVSDEKLIRILEFYDYISNNSEGWLFAHYGLADVHYDFDFEYCKYDLPGQEGVPNSERVQATVFIQTPGGAAGGPNVEMDVFQDKMNEYELTLEQIEAKMPEIQKLIDINLIAEEDIEALKTKDLTTELTKNSSLWSYLDAIFNPDHYDEALIPNCGKVMMYSEVNWIPTSHTYIVMPRTMDVVLDLQKLGLYKRENKAAINKAKNDFLGMVFNGVTDLDTAWDNYYNTLISLGLDEYTEYINRVGYLYKEYVNGELITPNEKFNLYD